MRTFYKIIGLLGLVAIVFVACKSKDKIVKSNLKSEYQLPDRLDYRFMFYNCENLFDTIDDPIKRDEEFLPDGMRRWNTRKYYKKLNNTAKVITAVGGWQLPDIVGLCEIENHKTVEDIIHKTHLWKSDYKLIHYEAPDRRGIDVAFLYRSSVIFPISSRPINIRFPTLPDVKTRDILYVKAATVYQDTFHFFINHWPSRWGGQLNSEERRVYVASVLRKAVDSVFLVEKKPNIVIMGDLNDYPYNISLTKTLKANRNFENIQNNQLYNLAAYLQENSSIGSHKHAGEWGVLDQTIVSGVLLNGADGVKCTVKNVHIFTAPFLLTADKSYTGVITNRTYIGYKYNGGYSDHLPVFLDVQKIK